MLTYWITPFGKLFCLNEKFSSFDEFLLVCWLMIGMSNQVLMMIDDQPLIINLTVNSEYVHQYHGDEHENPPNTDEFGQHSIGLNTISGSNIEKPERFSCYQCTNCTEKIDFVVQVCDEGVTLCYVSCSSSIIGLISFSHFSKKTITNMGKLSRNVDRGCSTSKDQCIMPENAQPENVDSVTCCNHIRCNLSRRFTSSWKILLFLMIIITIELDIFIFFWIRTTIVNRC